MGITTRGPADEWSECVELFRNEMLEIEEVDPTGKGVISLRVDGDWYATIDGCVDVLETASGIGQFLQFSTGQAAIIVDANRVSAVRWGLEDD